MKTSIEMRLIDNGKWNKEILHISNEMVWKILTEYDNIENAKLELVEFNKKKVHYEYRIKQK